MFADTLATPLKSDGCCCHTYAASCWLRYVTPLRYAEKAGDTLLEGYWLHAYARLRDIRYASEMALPAARLLMLLPLRHIERSQPATATTSSLSPRSSDTLHRPPTTYHLITTILTMPLHTHIAIAIRHGCHIAYAI